MTQKIQILLAKLKPHEQKPLSKPKLIVKMIKNK